jgi:hypothetical protein
MIVFANRQQQRYFSLLMNTTNSSFSLTIQQHHNINSNHSMNFYSRQQHHPQQHYEQYIQYRYFDSRKVRKRKKGKNPFKVLAIPEGSLYKDVKRKFLKIAMTNHPDTHSEDLSQEEKDTMRDRFINARVAFESLVEDPTTGVAVLLSEKSALTEEENFDSWFKSETGLNNPFHFDMDPETMKEVAKMTEAIGGVSCFCLFTCPPDERDTVSFYPVYLSVIAFQSLLTFLPRLIRTLIVFVFISLIITTPPCV